MARMHVSAIVAAGGRGTRLGASVPKQLLPLAGRPILARSVDALLASGVIDDLVIALPDDLLASPPEYLNRTNVRLVAGGLRRRDSVAAGFARIDPRADVVVVHDAARPFVSPDVIARTVDAAARNGAAIAALPAHDTVKEVDAGAVTRTLPRERIWLAQTPQAFRPAVLRDALAQDGDATDEAALAERAGHPVMVVDGDPRNIKITTADDLAAAERLVHVSAAVPRLRVGNGYDLHRLVPGRPLRLGGILIPYERGLDGHSDADAVCHAVTDAILGACGAGDIGRHFPDTDPAWKDADSLGLLQAAVGIVRDRGFAIVNVDVVVIAQRPKLAPHAPAMTAALARALGVDGGCVSVKGKTNEGVDSMGLGDSIAVHAVALVSAL